MSWVSGLGGIEGVEGLDKVINRKKLHPSAPLGAVFLTRSARNRAPEKLGFCRTSGYPPRSTSLRARSLKIAKGGAVGSWLLARTVWVGHSCPTRPAERRSVLVSLLERLTAKRGPISFHGSMRDNACWMEMINRISFP